MRNIFLALVLANLAFAAWHLWLAPQQSVPERTAQDVPGVTLVSELPEDLTNLPSALEPPSGAAAVTSETAPQDSPVAPAAAVEADVTPIADRCTSVGPFRELAQAATAAATLRAAGYRPTQRVAEGDVWIGYWVYLEAIPTEREANEVLERFRAAGITDSYVIPNSDSGNLVSLGVFTEISGVSRRREEVRALGYEPTVVDRTRRATVYWVDVLLEPEQTLELDALQNPGRIVRLEQRDCPAPP
jgi:cell division septation protein DedD